MTPEFFKHNRQALVEKLQGGVVVLSAYSAMQRTSDEAHKFEQESNFWYLTGIERADWWVVIDGSRPKTWLVAPEMTEVERVFSGGLSDEEALAISGADEVVPAKEAEYLLRQLARSHSVAYSLDDLPGSDQFSFILNPAGRVMWRRLERIFPAVQDARLELSRLRAIKQPDEIKAIKKAIKLTADAFGDVKSKLSDLKYEYEIEAEFSHFFRSRGASGHAYDPIVASGKNACTLHYSSNNDRLRSGQLILIDIGARLGGYAADITRTYAYGKPSAFSESVHAALEAAHQEIVQLLKPGLSVELYSSKVDEIMKQALVDLKLIQSLSDDEAYRRYFPHSISHGLGIDVHDPLGRPAKFAPGMVLTVEPGIYIPEKSVGARIEDNILITDSGYENLSRSLSTSL